MTDTRDSLIAVLDKRCSKLSIMNRAHWFAAKRYQRLSRALGIPVVVLTTATGTAIFVSFESGGAPERLRVAAGIFALIAAVLAGLQTFLNYSELSERHRTAAVAWGPIRRQCELMKNAPPESTEDLKRGIEEIDLVWAEAEKSSPSIPNDIYESAQEKQSKDDRKGSQGR